MRGPRSFRGVVAVLAAAVAGAACSSTTAHTSVPEPGAPLTGATASVPGAIASTSTRAPVTTAAAPPPPVVWKACVGNEGPSGYECGTVEVPLDYSNPGGRRIAIAVDRRAATGSKIGSLLMNPGGPGASGVDSLDYLASLLSPTMLAHFDVVSFDPRGVARSSPVRCATGAQLDQFVHLNPAPTTEAGFQQLLAGARRFDQQCQSMSGSILPFVGTVNVARDLDQIRVAVGDAQLTYIGFSYGTLLGAFYADLFPTHIRAMVLDGALNPALDPISTNIEQAAGFDQQLNAFFDYCRSSALCTWKPAGDLRVDYEALQARIAAHPLPTDDPARSLGPGESFFGVAQELYDQATWPSLGAGLAQAGQGDGSLLLQYSDDYTQRSANGAYTNALESNNAISCVDQPWPRDPTVVERAAARAKQRAPEFGVADLFGGLTCTAWPAPASSHPHPITAAASPPIVVVGSTGDPATPYVDAQALAGQLRHAILLTRVGDGHTGYRSSACIRSHVDAYLMNLTAPAAGISCPTP